MRCHQTALQAGHSGAQQQSVQNVKSQPNDISLNSCHKTASQGIPSEHGVQNAAQKEKETSQEPVMISGNQSASSDTGILWGVSQPLLKRRRWRQWSDLPQSLTEVEIEPEAGPECSPLTRRSLCDPSICSVYKREARNSSSIPRSHWKSTLLFHLTYSQHTFNQLYASNCTTKHPRSRTQWLLSVLNSKIKHWKRRRLILSPYSSNTVPFSEAFPYITLLMSNIMIFAMSVTHIPSKYWQGNHNVLCDFFQPLGVLSVSPTVRQDLLCSYELSYEPLSMQKAEVHLFWRNRWIQVQTKSVAGNNVLWLAWSTLGQ